MTGTDGPEYADGLDTPIDPSGIGQFVAHDRCFRYIKQSVDPGDEPNARDWTEAFTTMNVALLGHGQEFEARQVEALASDATRIIGPDFDDRSKRGVPAITTDETWADSSRDRREQISRAVAKARQLGGVSEKRPYLLLYQAPLGGQIGTHQIWGEADCIALAPAGVAGGNANAPAAKDQKGAASSDVVARVIEIKSGHMDKPANRAQVAIYSMLLEQTLDERPTARIETSVLTGENATHPGETRHPLDLSTFRREEWTVYARRLLAADGPITEALRKIEAKAPCFSGGMKPTTGNNFRSEPRLVIPR